MSRLGWDFVGFEGLGELSILGFVVKGGSSGLRFKGYRQP